MRRTEPENSLETPPPDGWIYADIVIMEPGKETNVRVEFPGQWVNFGLRIAECELRIVRNTECGVLGTRLEARG